MKNKLIQKNWLKQIDQVPYQYIGTVTARRKLSIREITKRYPDLTNNQIVLVFNSKKDVIHKYLAADNKWVYMYYINYPDEIALDAAITAAGRLIYGN